MKVRTYDEINPLAAFRLSLLAFGSAWDDARIRRARLHDRRYLAEFAFYAEERGRILAQVVPLRFRVRLMTGVEDVGGLAGVCSHPSHGAAASRAASSKRRTIGSVIWACASRR